MSERSEFKSHTYDNCNCSVSCGCQFNEPTTHGNCHFAYVGTIVDGHFKDTPLADLKWATLCIFPGEIAEGNARRQIVVDEPADAAQRLALERIISGEACVMQSAGRPIINEFNGEPFHIAIARPTGSFEFTYGEIGRGTTSVSGDLEMAFEDSWALFCVHHYDQDGLVRGK